MRRTNGADQSDAPISHGCMTKNATTQTEALPFFFQPSSPILPSPPLPPYHPTLSPSPHPLPNTHFAAPKRLRSVVGVASRGRLAMAACVSVIPTESAAFPSLPFAYGAENKLEDLLRCSALVLIGSSSQSYVVPREPFLDSNGWTHASRCAHAL